MKAPDKVYIQLSKGSELPRQKIVYTNRLSATSIEYVRKDALSEWASKENLKFSRIGNEQDDDFARGIAAGLGYLISKLYTL